MQIDVEIVARGIRPNDDLVDQRANAAHRPILRLLVGEAVNQLADSGAIALAHARLDELGFGIGAGQLRLNGVAFFDGGVEISLDLARIDCAGPDRFNELVALRHHLGEFLFEHASVGAALLARGHETTLILAAECFQQPGIEKILAEPEEDHLFETCLGHGEAVRAEPLVLVGRATEMFSRVLRISAAADAALDDA
ncbi:MAG: hypothetical protein ACT4OF_00465 [Caulobacteraceae bacterium]